MKEYPSIPHLSNLSQMKTTGTVVLFDKLDGSNIRAEWNKTKGFYKFGTRHQLISESDPAFGHIPRTFKSTFETLHKVFYGKKYESVICFFEYHGPNSFAGQHDENDKKSLTLIDINPYKHGIISPDILIFDYAFMDIAKSLYFGEWNKQTSEDLYNQVVSGTLPGMTFEGVVGKFLSKKD